MLISLSIFTSIFTYSQSASDNFWKKNHGNIYTPFIFILTVISTWEIINLLTFNTGINYSLLYLFYILFYVAIIFVFAINTLLFFLKNKRAAKYLLRKIPLLISLVFIAIFFLFFYRKYQTYQTDMWYWYQFMNDASEKGNNLFSSSPYFISKYSIYIPIGIYQFGSSLSISQRFYLFPYFTTFLFFYACITSSYCIIEKFLNKKLVLLNIFFICAVVFILIFYIFYCFSDWWPTIEGDWVSPSYFLLLVIPFLLDLKFAKNKKIIWIIPFFTFFISESSVLSLPFFIASILIVIYFGRKKYKFIISDFLLGLLFLFFSIYIFLTMSLNINLGKLYIGETIFSYLMVLTVLLYYLLLKFNDFYRINFLKFNFLISFWNSNFLCIAGNNNWFEPKKYFKQIFLIGILSLLFILCIFDIPHSNTNDKFQEICQIITTIIFLICVIKIVRTQKNNLFFNFLVVFCLIFFITHIVSIGFNINSDFWGRLQYSGLTVGTAYIVTPKIIVLLIFVVMFAVDFNKQLWVFSIIIHKHNNRNLPYLLSTLVLAPTICIPIPLYQVLNEGLTLPSLEIPQNLFSFGLSESTLQKIHNFNFDNNLTFSDIFLPSINSTAKTNLQMSFYPPYNQMDFFYYLLSIANFKNIDGDRINSYNKDVFENEILPYYSLICLKSNDSFFLNIMKENSSQYHLIENINQKVFIFKNIHLDSNMQEVFLNLNSSVDYQIHWTGVTEEEILNCFNSN